MKKCVLLTAALALTASFALGYLGQVVNSFPAPGRNPWALARANNPDFMWVYCTNDAGTVHRINAYTGIVLGSFNSVAGIATNGLTYNYGGGGGLPSGSYLWMGSPRTYHIYRCNYWNGSVYASFPIYASGIAGLAAKATADGGYRPTCMLSSNPIAKRIYHKDLITGSIQSVFVCPYVPQDLAWDWRNEIIWTGWAGNTVYGYSTRGSIVASFSMPANYPRGFCYFRRYLWVSTIRDHRIWQIHCPATVSVEPASIGRIKAAFR